MKEYSYVDLKKEYKDRELFENVYAYYWVKENNKWIKKYDTFENKDFYFFIDPSEAFKAPGLNLKVYNKKYRTVNGKDCIKVEPNEKLNSKQFKELREKFKITYESDIPALTRWIANNKPKYTKKVRKLYIDIETIKDTKGNYSPPGKAEAPIIMITCYDNFTEEYKTFLFKETNQKAEVFKNEKEMLFGFLNYLRDIDPDYILGWNIESYDIPYIINRFIHYSISPNTLSNLNFVTYRQNDLISSHKFSSFYINIRGMGIFDLMSASQRLWLGKTCGYSLDKMSGFHLDENKIEVDDIDELYEKDINQLIKYNIKDVELCVRLDNELQLFKKFQSFQDIISINVHNTLIQSNNIVQYLLQNTDVVLLNSNHKIGKQTFAGGFVLDSIPGIYKNSYKFDFVSMYPSIMITYNISPDTILEKKEYGCINMDNKYFFKKSKGIITKVVGELYQKRMEYKKARNKDLDLAYKLLMNSIYGQFTAPYSRMFGFTCGEAITYQGRRMIKNLVQRINESLNGKIVLGDTDSLVFNPNKEIEPKEILKIFNKLMDEIYDKDEIEHNKLINLELEKIIEKLIIFGNGKVGIKKKYVEYSENKKRLVGLDSIKSDTQEIAKDLQNELIDFVIENDNCNREDIEKIINNFKDTFKNALRYKKYKYVAIPAKLNKDIKSYKTRTFAIKAIENKNLNVSINEKFFIIVTKDGPLGFKNLIDLKETKFEIDEDYMWDRISRKADIFLDLFLKQTENEQQLQS